MGGGLMVGRVVSNRMQKTVVVAVSYVVWVPRYKVYEKRVGRHMAHDEQQQCVVGDLVKIVTANRKLSKHKSYHVAQILRKAGVSSSEPAPPAVPLQPDTVPSMLEVAQQRVAAAEARLAAAKQLYLERMRSASQPAPSATSKPASDAFEALLPASPSQPAQAAMQQPRLGLGPAPSPSQPVPGSSPVRLFSSQAVSSRDRAHHPLALALAGGIGRVWGAGGRAGPAAADLDSAGCPPCLHPCCQGAGCSCSLHLPPCGWACSGTTGGRGASIAEGAAHNQCCSAAQPPSRAAAVPAWAPLTACNLPHGAASQLGRAQPGCLHPWLPTGMAPLQLSRWLTRHVLT
ncbi:hypothetical protein V8C86DRAFT_2779108 [Haematococcus lacustris]